MLYRLRNRWRKWRGKPYSILSNGWLITHVLDHGKFEQLGSDALWYKVEFKPFRFDGPTYKDGVDEEALKRLGWHFFPET
jgi:hypothetical protein